MKESSALPLLPSASTALCFIMLVSPLWIGIYSESYSSLLEVTTLGDDSLGDNQTGAWSTCFTCLPLGVAFGLIFGLFSGYYTIIIIALVVGLL